MRDEMDVMGPVDYIVVEFPDASVPEDVLMRAALDAAEWARNVVRRRRRPIIVCFCGGLGGYLLVEGLHGLAGVAS